MIGENDFSVPAISDIISDVLKYMILSTVFVTQLKGWSLFEINILNKLRDGLSILGITGNIEHYNKMLL
jgi:hypothetical protein